MTSSPDLTIEANGDQISVIMKPSLPSGRHVLRCMVPNPSRSRRTLLERVFNVHSNHPARSLYPYTATSHTTLARRLLQEPSHTVTSYALEYPLAGRTRFLMQTDWSHLMLLLNPLILAIILLCYWGCRAIALRILRKHAFTPSDAWVFVSDRQAKYAVFKQFFGTLPRWLATLCSRLFLFTSDTLIFYGVLLSLLLHLLLPVFFRDARVRLRLCLYP